MKQVIGFLNNFKAIRPRLFLCLALTLVFNLAALATPEVLRIGTNAITYSDVSMLKYAAVLAAVATVLYIALDAVIRIMQKDIGNRYEESAQIMLLEKIISIRKIRLGRFKSGEIVTHVLNNATDGVKNSLNAVLNMADGLLIIGLGLAYMGLIQWRITIVITLYNIAMRVIMKLLEKKVKANSRKAVGIAKSNNSFLFDLLVNMMTIRVFNKESWFNQKLADREKDTLRVNTVGNAWRNGMQDGMWAAIKMAEYFILYGYGGYLVYKGQTTLGSLLAFTMAIDMFTKGINCFTYALTDKNRAIANIEGMEEIMNISETENEPHTSLNKLGTDNPLISFKDVSFGYGDQVILENINFSISHNEKILIKGPNGQGKSTLLNLISGLYRPDSGEIRYADADISVVNLDEIVKTYAYISQSSNILQGDVYQNIALSVRYDQVLCDETLKKLNLVKVVNTAPQSLSQGEKQRLNIGRAIYRLNHVCIVLGDEIFANIDKENVRNIIAALKNEFEDRAVIMVCHEDIDFKFDRIFHVENKKVII